MWLPLAILSKIAILSKMCLPLAILSKMCLPHVILSKMCLPHAILSKMCLPLVILSKMCLLHLRCQKCDIHLRYCQNCASHLRYCKKMCHPLVTPTCQECDSCTCDIVKNVPPKYYCILTVKIDPMNIILPSLFLTNVNVMMNLTELHFAL